MPFAMTLSGLRIPSVTLKPTSSIRKRSTIVSMASTTPSLPGFDSEAQTFSVAIMGDLHLPASDAPTAMAEFHEAREQLVTMATRDVDAARVVQLGDLGSYEKGWPGSHACFRRGFDYISGFDLPAALILGNHDLEGDEFETDEANLAAWKAAFGQNHYWRADVGPTTFIGLSTVRFRSNPFSVHEVHIDDEQLAFLEATLQEATQRKRPVVLFTHAPPMGSGLKAIQSVHVKNRCAWLNHSSDPTYFARVVQRFPCIKLHFSGHFHLSQNYPDAISIVGGTAFVLTGVIGDASSRDGQRQSRILRGSEDGYEVYTVDHDANSMRLDLKGSWEVLSKPQYLVPEGDLLCDPASGWLCSKVQCDVEPLAPPDMSITWLNIGPAAMLTLQDEVLVEYDVPTMAPVGAAFIDVPEGGRVRLVDASGYEVDAITTDGSDAVAVEVVDPETGEVVRRAERNAAGTFYQIFQPNKWVARKLREREQQAMAGSVAATS